MENTNQTAQSTLDHKLVGDICGTFFVPGYQRGYRWDNDDVQRLLDDIWGSNGQDYNLQPVVVKLRKEGDDEQGHEWELIDGQQRLTTLYLIFLYMTNRGLQNEGAPFSIRYETRHGSATFLGELGTDSFDRESHKRNIDYFHLYQAYECIDRWFETHRQRRQHVANKFYSYLFDSVRVIWYQAKDTSMNNSITLFTRLNVGRIPLTDAELVKALLLSSVRKASPDRAQEIAAQWDGIERDLRNPDIWAFVAGADSEDDADKYPTRISLLLDMLADELTPLNTGEKRPRYRTFDMLRGQIEIKSIDFWNDCVVKRHSLILGWFGTPYLYNKIGFLVVTGTPLGDLAQLAQAKKKSEFDNSLNEHIRKKIEIRESGLLSLRYDNKIHQKKLLSLLLLMNVETVSRTGQHFPFRRHVGKKWSLEHIHAQSAESLTTIPQWKTWLQEHQKALGTLSNQHALVQDIEVALQKIDTDQNFGPTFQSLADQVMAVFTAPAAIGTPKVKHDMHSISNLALLCCSDNSALNNAVFEVKRQTILEIDRNQDGKNDGYIPVCTRNVFLKYYTDANAQQIHFWSPQDRENYFKALIAILKDYFTLEAKAEELAQ